MPRPKTPRLGRPPASSAAETRQRILDVACDEFALRGYGVTTNKEVADKAGITTGALYYYFDSKLEMYLAVFDHLQEVIYGKFDGVLEDEHTFDGSVRAILEAAYEINVENPSIARFQGTARVDRARHPELAAAIKTAPGEGARLVPRLLELGLETGEIEPGREAHVAAVLRTMFAGLTDALSANPAEQRIAIDGLHLLLDGKLLRPARAAKTKRRR